MQEGVDKIIEDATTIDGDGFENMDMVVKILSCLQCSTYSNLFNLNILIFKCCNYLQFELIFRFNILPLSIELIRML